MVLTRFRFGRGGFLDAKRIFDSFYDAAWEYLRYPCHLMPHSANLISRLIAFDEPSKENRALAMEDRYKILFNNLSADNPVVVSAVQELILLSLIAGIH